MLKNYFKTTLRNFQRHIGYTAINIAGLAVGMATSIFLFLWINDELSYDAFHKNKDTLYQMLHHAKYTDGTIETFTSTSAPFAEVVRAEIPEVEYAVRADWGSSLLFNYEDVSFLEYGYYTDKGFLNMFSYNIIEGNAANPVPDINSIAISKKLADKYFPKQNAIGKIFKVDRKYDMKVTAVFEDVPLNSSMRFDFILDFERYAQEREWMKNWGNSTNQTFIKLHASASPETVNEKLAKLFAKNCEGCFITPFLHAYKDLRLFGNYKNGKQDGGRIEYVRAFSVVAIFILLIACINFMNLATARSATRSREVGVRKVIGAQRSSLVIQFIGEAVLISFISLLLAITFVELGLPFFNMITEKNITLHLSDPIILTGLLSITILTGVLAGSYPAFVLSSFQPISVLKGNKVSLLSGAGLRKSLVVFQFAISAVLISGSIMVNEQIQYIRNKNLGFDRKNIITSSLWGSIGKNIEAYKIEAMRHPGVISISTAQHNPFDVQNSTTDPIWPGKQKGEEKSFRVITSDADFIPTLGMKLITGRNFSGQSKADTSNYIINEAAAKAMGLKDPVGTPLEMWFGKGQIIGVVKDFHNQNFRDAIEPLIFTYYPDNSWRIFIRLDSKNIEQSLAHLEKVHKKFEDVFPFDYSFLDKQFEDQYRAENTTGRLSIFFMVIAIFISCLGLFGLASFTAERRTKEIGVRKVLGASIPNLITLLCADFTKLIIVSLCVGIPIAYYLTTIFLDQYIFHTELNGWVFVITGLAILTIALITVIYQSAKAAWVNPVNSLRND
jgi:ABC-type antimicrobial peptide transport system permease subunit